MKISQKQIILNVLREKNDWVPSWELIMKQTKWGWLGSQAKRRAQELLVEGKISKKMEGKYVYYRTPEIIYREVRVLDLDGNVEKTIRMPM